ncbi:hypothetical protein pb186bvf_000090 [Paramecium bursaria]
MDNIKVQRQVEIVLHGQEYKLNVNASDRLLSIELEAKYDAKFWKNTYTSDYIEEITKKTGNPRKFQIFLNMLQSAITKQNDNVFYEVLTFQDLENLKSQKLSESGQSYKSSSSNTKNNKRYLILSYQNEFEKVHYPLALNYEDQIDQSKLMSKIEFMRTELYDFKNRNSEEFQTSRDSFNKSKSNIIGGDSVKNENELLKAKIKRLEEALIQKKGALEVDQLIRDYENLNQQMQILQKESQDKINKLESTLIQRNQELAMQGAELNAFKKELTSILGKSDVDKRIKDHIQHMNYEEENQIQKHLKYISKLEKEIEGLNQQMDFFRKQDAIQKRRITQLENELQSSMKKFSYKGVTDRLYSPYSNQSNGSRKSNYSMPNKPASVNASPNLSKNSRNSTQNSTKQNVQRQIFNQSPTTAKNNFNRKPSPVRPVTQQKPQLQNNRVSPNQRAPINNKPSNYNKSPLQNRQNYQQQQQQQKPRTNYSAQNPTTKNQVVKNQYISKNMDLDSKINNLRNMLNQAKR